MLKRLDPFLVGGFVVLVILIGYVYYRCVLQSRS